MRACPLAPTALVLALLVLAAPARASPDPRASQDRLEEQVLDGDRDLEDLVALRLAPTSGGLGRVAPAYLGLEGYVGDRSSGGREFGLLAVLELPLERFARGASPPPRPLLGAGVGAPPLAPGATALLGGLEPAAFLAEGGGGERGPSAPPSGAAPSGVAPVNGGGAVRAASAAPAIVITADAARACVRAAWRTVGLGDDARLDSMAARARSSAAFPELRLRLARTIDQSGRVTLTEEDPSRYTQAGGATNWFEARLTFRLDRLLFADEEVSMERIRIERLELRARTAAKALQALFDWQRARALAADPSLPTDQHLVAVLRELEAASLVDVMTDGWLARFRASSSDGRPE